MFPPHKEMFHYLENFHKNIERRFKYGISFFDCENAIYEVCQFFEIDPPAFISDLTEHPQGQTMFVDSNKYSYADDIICYSMEELKSLGIKTKDAFSLVMTHECAHRLLQNTHLPGLNDGSWEEELCCDFFMGVRAGLGDIDPKAMQAVREGLSQSEGSTTHPTGKLRYDIISYGYTWVGGFDLIHHRKRSRSEYIRLFDEWRIKHLDEIREAQRPFFS